jgi:hypothetical protein
MSKLKDYVESLSRLGYDDLHIIEAYLSDNHLETEFSEMVIRLTASQLDRVREQKSFARFVTESTLMNHRADYTPEENNFLDRLTRHLAFDPEKCLAPYENEIRAKIPNMEMPNWCYVDVVAIINYKYKVFFKGQTTPVEFIDQRLKKYCDTYQPEKSMVMAQ